MAKAFKILLTRFVFWVSCSFLLGAAMIVPNKQMEAFLVKQYKQYKVGNLWDIYAPLFPIRLSWYAACKIVLEIVRLFEIPEEME